MTSSAPEFAQSRRIQARRLRAAPIAFLVLLANCSSPAAPGPGTPAPTVTSVTVSGSAATATVGQTSTLVATATFSNGTSSNVTGQATWASSDQAIATVTSAGAVNFLSVGPVDLRATYQGVTGSTRVTVMAPLPTTTAVTVSGVGPQATVGTSAALTAIATLSDATTTNVTTQATWTSSDNAVATVSSAGTVSFVAAGTVDLRAMFSGVTGSIRVTAVPLPTVTSVTVSGAASEVAPGGPVALTAIATYSDGATTDVTNQAAWSSSDLAVATITGSGAATFVAPGNVDLRATFNGVTGSIRVSVIATALVATVTGRVTDLIDGSPLAGAAVQIVGGPNQGQSTQTGPDGSYTLPNLKTGLLVVMFTQNAYNPFTRELDLSQDADMSVGLSRNFSIFYGTFDIAMTITQQTCDSPVTLPPTGTLQLVGGNNGTNVEARVTERGITRIYEGGTINSKGQFTGVLPPGTLLPGFMDRGLQPKHEVSGTITGTVNGNTISGVEMMVYSIPCPGTIITVAFTGSK